MRVICERESHQFPQLSLAGGYTPKLLVGYQEADDKPGMYISRCIYLVLRPK